MWNVSPGQSQWPKNPWWGDADDTKLFAYSVRHCLFKFNR